MQITKINERLPTYLACMATSSKQAARFLCFHGKLLTNSMVQFSDRSTWLQYVTYITLWRDADNKEDYFIKNLILCT